MRKTGQWLALLLAVSMLGGCGSTGSSQVSHPGKDTISGTEEGADNSGGDKDGQTSGTGSADGSSSGSQGTGESKPAKEYVNKEQTSSSTGSGIRIKVDYSNYKPNQTRQNRYTRLREEEIPDLQAADDYGAIYPFIASTHYSSYDNGYSYVAGYTYGIADESGRIVADPTYTSVFTLCAETYYLGKRVQLPFYALGRVEVNSEQEDDEWIDGRTVYALASYDGSFVTECKYSVLIAAEVGVLLAEDYSSSEFTMYDLNGRVMFTQNDLRVPGTVTAGSFYGSYGDGLFQVNNDRDEAYYIDARGRVVLGPYQYATAFANGLAMVETAQGDAVIDTEGNYVLKPKGNDRYERLRSGYYTEQNGDRIIVYDTAGKELFRAQGDGYVEYKQGGMFFITRDRNAYNIGDIYDRSGKKLRAFDYDEEYFTEMSGISYRCEGDDTIVSNVQTKAEVKLEGSWWFHDIYISGESLEMAYSDYLMGYKYDEDTGESERKILSKNTLKEVHAEVDNLHVKYDIISGERLLCGTRKGKYCTLDDDLNVVREYSSEPVFMNGYVRCVDSRGCHIYSPEGEEIFYYSMVASYDD